MKCQAILKSGERIGQECRAKAKMTIDGRSYCGRHCMIKKEMKGECTITQKRLCNNSKCDICHKRSFASHDKVKYWNYYMNKEIMPRDVFKSSGNKYWFTCDICNHSFDARLDTINRGQWCPYCRGNHKLCNNSKCDFCLQRSFASHDKVKYWNYYMNKEIIPRDVFKSSGNKYWFTCDKCIHSFDAQLADINQGRWCPYCGNHKLCNNSKCDFCLQRSFASHYRSSCWDNVMNKEKPRDVFKSSGDKYWFTCDTCNHSFNAQLNSINQGTWCPTCKNKTESKLREWLTSKYSHVEYQYNVEWCRNPDTGRYLPFDFYLPDDHKIIELDGMQHFEQVSNWKTPKITQDRDKYKQDRVISHGLGMIRISQEDVLNDTFNWQRELIEAISSQEKIIYLSKDESLYDTHKKLHELKI